MWYQAIKCSDGNKKHDFLFGVCIRDRGDYKRLAIKKTSDSYDWDGADGLIYKSTWNYNSNHCNFIFKGE
jgi:hypothetical protein